jgi:hypothetical protein
MNTTSTTIGLLLAILPTTLRAQAECYVRGNAVTRLVDARGESVVSGVAAPLAVAEGTLAAHFAADAAGKPRSLSLNVVDGGRVRVAVAAAQPVLLRVIGADELRAAPTDANLLALPEWSGASIRAAVRWSAMPAGGGCGPAVRIGADGSHYRGAWDATAGEYVLMRRMGKDEFAIARAKAVAGPRRDSILTLQADGFRLQLECDDAVVLQTFDGALDVGGVGAWVPEGAALGRLSVSKAAPPRASVALVEAGIVEAGMEATLHAATTSPPDAWAVVEYVLDRPDALQPAVTWLPWRGLVGFGAVQPIERDGTAVAVLRLPATLGLHSVSARIAVVDASGTSVLERTPALAVTPRAVVD